jgi:hypothetical protein
VISLPEINWKTKTIKLYSNSKLSKTKTKNMIIFIQNEPGYIRKSARITKSNFSRSKMTIRLARSGDARRVPTEMN